MTLTTALSILGVVVLLALALQAWWQARRLTPRQSLGQAAGGPAGARQEPALDDTTQPLADEPPPPLRLLPRRVPRLFSLLWSFSWRFSPSS